MDSDESLYAALGRVPSGIYIVTLGGESPTGMLASWVQQAGFDPPMLTIALQQGRRVAERIEAGEPFVVNLVGEGQTKFLKHFGKGFGPEEPAFEGIELVETSAGVPGLAEAVGTLECQAASGADASDHRVVIARVTAGALLNDIGPMTHIRKRGDRY